MNNSDITSRTESVCPVCLKKLDAVIVTDGNESFMEKNCSEHGTFRTIIWKGSTKRRMKTENDCECFLIVCFAQIELIYANSELTRIG
jgi:hypothetical protein